MFKLKSKKGIHDKVTGLFTSIFYEVRIQTGNWIAYFGKYQNQKWAGYDTDSCWALSGINCIEDQLEWLYRNGQFSQEAKQFFLDKGYIDSDNDFSLSERFIEILSGARQQGNNQMNLWKLVQNFGCIPRSMLTYTREKAQNFGTNDAFQEDYFDESNITNDMINEAIQFLSYVNIERQWIGQQYVTPELQVLKAALRQAPLQIGIPIPKDVSKWNDTLVEYDGGKYAQHAVELYNINADGTYAIYDQYEPHLKVLSKDYFLPFVTQGVVTPKVQIAKNPIVQNIINNKVWQAVFTWFNESFMWARAF